MDTTTTTIREKIHNILTEYHKAVIELFQSLTDAAAHATSLNTEQPPPTKAPPDLMKKVIEKEIELNQAVKERECGKLSSSILEYININCSACV